MHDIRAVRSDPAGFDAAMSRRGLPPITTDLLALDAERRAAQTTLQDSQARRNALAKEIGQGRRGGTDTVNPRSRGDHFTRRNGEAGDAGGGP